MTDITDKDRRTAIDVAEAIERGDYPRASMWPILARVILATVDAPEPTIAERLRSRADLLDNGDPDGDTPQALRTLADLVDQMERESDEARAEVERLTREQGRLNAQVQGLTRRDGDHNSEVRMLTEERDEALAEVERLTAVQKGAERNAEILDPSDVKPGEVWKANIWYDDVPYSGTAIKSSGGDWTVTRDDGSHTTYRMNEYVELVSRLAPAPRVITNPYELDRAKHLTVIRDGVGVVCERASLGNEWFTTGNGVDQTTYIKFPVTVLWEPED